MPSTLATVAPLRYSPAYEHPDAEEAKTLADINEQMHRIQEKTYADGGKAIRSVHAKSHGLLTGELRIPAGLPPELAQGIFARPGMLPVVMPERLANTDLSKPNTEMIGSGPYRMSSRPEVAQYPTESQSQTRKQLFRNWFGH